MIGLRYYLVVFALLLSTGGAIWIFGSGGDVKISLSCPQKICLNTPARVDVTLKNHAGSPLKVVGATVC